MFLSLRAAADAFRLVLLVVTGLACFAGCALQRQRHLEPAARPVPTQEDSTDERFSMEPYLRANRLGRWTYSRTPVGEPDGAAVAYVRMSDAARMLEGVLVGRDFLPLENYLQRPGPTTRPEGRQRPQAPLQSGSAFMFELHEPLEPLPADLEMGVSQTASTPIVYYEYNGQVLARGTLTRTVGVEGFEDVDTPAGHFANCLRARVDLTVQIPWMFKMDWATYLWLSPEMGEVRRIEQMSGLFLIFFFSSSHEYRFTSGQPYMASPEPESVHPPRWRYGAVLMDRTVPRPRIAGMVVDYSSSPTATQPAGTPSTETQSVETQPTETHPAQPLPSRAL